MNALAVVNLGGRAVHPKSRESFEAASRRWGVKFIEITDPVLPEVHVYWQKALAHRTLGEFDQVLQLDADMLIRSDCPSPFDVVKPEEIGVVSAHQYLRWGWIESRNICIREWAKRLRMRPCRDERHLNGGFLLYSPAVHESLLEQWCRAGASSGWTNKFLPEQASLSVLLANLQPSQRWLPHTWNTVGAVQTERTDYWSSKPHNQRAWIYHFTGGNKAERIHRTWWNIGTWGIDAPIRSQAVLKRVPKDCGVFGVEVGVLRGHNAQALLHYRPRLTLCLVDRWAEYPKSSTYYSSGNGNSEWNNDDWRMIQQEALQNLAPYYGRFRLLQTDSLDASKVFENHSLDFVYIDADHSYEACRADIQAWEPKVRRGGWIGGHDYGDGQPKWGVKQAVDEIFGKPLLGQHLTWFVDLSE